MPGPLFPVVLATATAVVGSFFKNIDAKLSDRREHRNAELNKAHKIYEEISDTLDSLQYYQQDVAIYVAIRRGMDKVREKVDEIAWNDYLRVVKAWQANETRLIAEYEAYFGSEYVQTLVEITDVFIVGKSYIGGTYFTSGSDNDLVQKMRDGEADEPEYEKFFSIYEGIRSKIKLVVFDMNHKLSREAIGTLKRKRI